MEYFYAICPFCDKSILIDNADSENCTCSVCGQSLNLSQLKANGLIIDAEQSESQYQTAMQYFINNDFKEAKTHFLKVLEYNRNHYLADYYAALCEIYENDDNGEFDVPKQIVDAVVKSVQKLELCRTGIKDRLDFLNAVLNQSYIILSSHFNKIYENYENTEMWDILRDKCLNIAAAIKELTDVDKEKLMVFDSGISRSLTNIADLALCACRKIVYPHMLSETVLDLPTDYQYEKAKSLYNHLLYFATSISPDYKPANQKTDYTGNLLYNESVIGKLNRYNNESKTARKKRLSVKSASFEEFRKSAAVAIKYSYHNCFKTLYTPSNDQARTALINDSISFCLELLMPRIIIDDEKKVTVNVKTFSEAKDIAVYLNEFLHAFEEYNHKLTAEYINKFLKELYETVHLYYTSVYLVYNKHMDRLKQAQDSEYRYYKNFLHGIIYSCAVALTEIIPICRSNISERLKILKLGKQANEEFLLLNDYKIEELEQSIKYSDVLDIFNAFDDNIEELSSKH